MAGIEKVTGYKCNTCDSVHEDLDGAFGCCGVNVTIEWSAQISGTTTVYCTSEDEWRSAKEQDSDIVDIEVHDNNGNDTDVNDVDIQIDSIESPYVEGY